MATEGAIPAGVEAGLRTMEDARTRARVAAVLGTPQMQQAIHQVSSGLTQGAVDGLSSDEMSDHLNKLVSQLVRTLMSELSRGADNAMDGATSPARQQQIEVLTH